MQYAYNLASELTSITYPSGRVVPQSYDGDRHRAMKDQASDSTYDKLYWYGLSGQAPAWPTPYTTCPGHS